MFKLIMQNLFHKPATRKYPFESRLTFERSRGHVIFNSENCVYCGLCARKCPADAIKVDRTNKTIKLNTFRCIICSECITSCPKKSIILSNERIYPAKEKVIFKVSKNS